MGVGDRIKNLREEHGFTQTDFANSIGVSKQTLYKYENNIITNIPSDKIEAIAKRFCISPGYLMGWEDKLIKDIADLDAELTEMDDKVKEYALKINRLSEENKKYIMHMIDLAEKFEGDENK